MDRLMHLLLLLKWFGPFSTWGSVLYFPPFIVVYRYKVYCSLYGKPRQEIWVKTSLLLTNT